MNKSGGNIVVNQPTSIPTHVVICDWHGVVRWISADETLLKRGDLFWQHVVSSDRQMVIDTFGRVITTQQAATIEIAKKNGKFYRVWLWPLDSPEMAVCALRMEIPSSVRLLTRRERDTLVQLARGNSVKEIAGIFDVSVNTIHTHLRRSKDKLKIKNTEGLIAFASMHCQQGWEIGTQPTNLVVGTPGTGVRMEVGLKLAAR